MLCDDFIFMNQRLHRQSSFLSRNSSIQLSSGGGRRRFCRRFITNAKDHSDHSKKNNRWFQHWFQRFFFNEDGNWFGLKDEDMLVEEDDLEGSSDLELSEGEKFEAWRRRAEAITELREAQEDMRNEESRRWEDWLVDGNGTNDVNNSSWDSGIRESEEIDPTDLIPDKGLVKTVRDLVLGRDEEDLLYEDRVFRYASLNSAKFLAVLVIIPWALDFLVHDYVLMPFLDRYVKTVPLAAEVFDVRRHQKLEMVKELKVEKARLQLEVEIGKSPPLSDEEVWLELRHKALEMRDEWRLENRRGFANIWSDMVFGVSLFIILYFNQTEVALLKFTGYKILNNISDTGKAFLIILLTDIFLGYHSESGWQTLLEIVVEHYGIEIDRSAITIFISIIPVIIDACVKLWLFKFLPRLSPKVSNIFQEMKRH